MFVSSTLPSYLPSTPSYLGASAARPPLLHPTPRSTRERWLAEKRFKVDRSPDLNGGNGFAPSLLDSFPSAFGPLSVALPSPTTSRPPSPHLSLPSLVAFLVRSRKRRLLSPQVVGTIFVILVLGLLRLAIHSLAPQTLMAAGAPAAHSTADLVAPIWSPAAVPDRLSAAGIWARLSGSKEELQVFTPPVEPPKHRSTANGLLEVDPSLPATQHPIYQLIDEAKDEWEAKVARQSKTLSEAVAEYKRRHGRPPPKGFNHWWAYVQQHSVALPDEYDRISIDLQPFWALSPSLLRRRIADLQAPGDGHESFTLAVKGGQATTSHVNFESDAIGGSLDRVKGQLELISDVAQYLPDFEAVYSIHDAPTRFISHGHRQDLEDLYEDGAYLDPLEEADTDGNGWAAACPYGSPLRKHGEQPIPAGKSFIKSHTRSMDLCAHPSVPALHGLTLGTTPVPQTALMPMFSLSKTNLHADILGIPVEGWRETPRNAATNWTDKQDDRLLWRGRNTGGFFSKAVDWRSSHRARLAAMSGDDARGWTSILPSPGSLAFDDEPERSLGNATVERSLGQLNRAMLDVGLAYEPIQCSEADNTCNEIADELTFRPVKTFEEEAGFRYILDVDGNAWSARFKRLLSTGSLVLKSSIFPEWWNDRVQPWYHYVPVKVDYSDIYDIQAFFRGTDEAGAEGESALAERIASQGLEWSHTHWRKEDLTAYVFRLYLEYARLVSPNRNSMNFELPPLARA